MSVRCSAHAEAVAEASCERCGDFVCGLCTDLPDVAAGERERSTLCPRCALRCTVAWEVRGEESWLAAFWLTWAEAMTSPRRLGEKLSGSGYGLPALSYVLFAGALGGLPLALSLATLSARGADPFTLGLGSTSALSASAAWVFGALSASTALCLLVVGWALVARALTRALGEPLPFALLLRVLAYGLSPVAVPCAGPLLALAALGCAGASLHACLRTRGTARTARVVSATSGLIGMAGVLLALSAWTA